LVLLALNLHIQIRQEERFLAARFGAAYVAYAARVGRYLALPDLRRARQRLWEWRRPSFDQEQLL